MGRHDELKLREKFEGERLELLAGRLLRLTGCCSMVLALDNNDDVDIWCSTGRLLPSGSFIDDALGNSEDGEEKPLCEIVSRS